MYSISIFVSLNNSLSSLLLLCRLNIHFPSLFNCFMVFSTTVVFPTASTPSIIINIGSFSRFSFFSIFFCVSFVIFLNINSFLFIHLPFSYHLQYFSSSLSSIFTLYSSILLNYILPECFPLLFIFLTRNLRSYFLFLVYVQFRNYIVVLPSTILLFSLLVV